MKIFYTNSPRGREKYADYYDKAVETLQNQGVEVISLEIQDYSDLLGKEAAKKYTKNEQHYLYIRKGIDIANAVVIDASVDSFSLGHESTLALLYKKPFLCISNNWDYSRNIKHPKFNSRQYKDVDHLEKVLIEFVNEVRNKFLSVRFNGYLSPEQKNFLDWYSDKTGQNVSEIIRNLISEQMQKELEYKDDLSQYFKY